MVDHAQDSPSLARRVLKCAGPYRSRLVLALVLSLVASGLSLAVPKVIQHFLDGLLQSGAESVLVPTVALLVGVFGAQALTSASATYQLGWIGSRIVADLRTRLYTRLLTLDIETLANQPTGELISRLSNDTETVRNGATGILRQLVVSSLVLIGSLLIVFFLNWRLSLVVLIIGPLLYALVRVAGSRIQAISADVQTSLGRATALAEEALSGAAEVKAYLAERYEARRFSDGIEDVHEHERKRYLISAFFRGAVMLTTGAAVSLIVWYGAVEIDAGRLTAGGLVAFLMYGGYVVQHASRLSSIYTQIASLLGSAERVFTLLDMSSEIPTPDDPIPRRDVDHHPPRIRFDSVCFGYDGEDRVLHDVSFTLDPGETVAVVGPSGAGKSTLLHLLLRLHEPDEGRILVDGCDIREMDVAELRSLFAIVQQQTNLFAGSIAENILYGCPDAPPSVMRAAAESAGVDLFAPELSQPADGTHELGARGHRLSGGEQQRVALARALATGAPVLLLDEPTSALDVHTESIVLDAIRERSGRQTTFVAAHRRSLVDECDRVLLLVDGEVVAAGTARELERSTDFYSRFIETLDRPTPASTDRG